MNFSSGCRRNSSFGLVSLPLIVLVGICVFALFFIDLQKEAERPLVQKNTSYIGKVVAPVWNAVKRPAEYFYSHFLIDVVWNPFTENMDNIKNGRPTDLEKMAPQIDS